MNTSVRVGKGLIGLASYLEPESSVYKIIEESIKEFLDVFNGIEFETVGHKFQKAKISESDAKRINSLIERGVSMNLSDLVRMAITFHISKKLPIYTTITGVVENRTATDIQT